jgi:hypothetical protein
MIQFLSKCTILFLVFSLSACAQKKLSPAEKYIEFLNNYQKDSLDALLTDDFVQRRTFAKFSNNKTSLLNWYIPYSQAVDGKYEILEVISDKEPQQFLVKDISEYFRYLKIDYPQWKLIISTKGNKVTEVVIDTTETYQKYIKEVKLKDEHFRNWLKKKYPDDDMNDIQLKREIFLKRLKEFSEQE